MAAAKASHRAIAKRSTLSGLPPFSAEAKRRRGVVLEVMLPGQSGRVIRRQPIAPTRQGRPNRPPLGGSVWGKVGGLARVQV